MQKISPRTLSIAAIATIVVARVYQSYGHIIFLRLIFDGIAALVTATALAFILKSGGRRDESIGAQFESERQRTNLQSIGGFGVAIALVGFVWPHAAPFIVTVDSKAGAALDVWGSIALIVFGSGLLVYSLILRWIGRISR